MQSGHLAERVIKNLLDQIDSSAAKQQAPLPLAPSVRGLKNEGAYAVLAAATALEQQGKNIVHLEIGQPDFPTPKHIVQAGVGALSGGETTYTNPSGTIAIKEAIAEFVSKSRCVTVTPDEIVVGPGCKPGLFFAAMAIIEKGDEVVLPDPCFPTYTNMVDVAGGVSVMCPLDSDRRCFDMAALEACITDKTRLLVVNSPGNPTGGVISLSEMQAIADIVAKYPRCWVISDEIYSQLIYDKSLASEGGSAPSLLQIPELRDRCVMVDGFSKTYCMTGKREPTFYRTFVLISPAIPLGTFVGWRLGYAVCPPALAERLHLLMTHAVGCTAAFTQVAGVEALRGPQDCVAEMVQEYTKRRDYVIGRLNAMEGVTCPTPAGAFYAFPNVSALGKPCEEIASLLLKEGGVAVLPGTDFGECGQGHIRLSYVRDMATLKEGLDRMEKTLAGLR